MRRVSVSILLATILPLIIALPHTGDEEFYSVVSQSGFGTIYPFAIEFEKVETKDFRTDETRTIPVKFSHNVSFVGDARFFCELSRDCEVLKPQASVALNMNEANNFSQTVNVTVLAKFLGYSKVVVQVNNQTVQELTLKILRSAYHNMLSKIFTGVVAVFIIFVTFLMGTQLHPRYILEIMRHPVGPVIGFVCQFGMMPIIAYFLSTNFLAGNSAQQFSLFASGCSPGGGKSSFWTIIFSGNLDLSVSMTLTQTIGAAFMMPIWVYTVGVQFFQKDVQIPFIAFAESLATLLLPSIAGMIFIYYNKDWTKRCERGIKIATWFATIFFTCFGIYVNFYVFTLMSWRNIVCGCAQPWCGYMFAYVVAWIFGQNHRDRLTIAIETGIQNVGVAMVMIMFSLPEPEVDLAMVQPIALLLMTDKPLLIIWFVRKCYNSFKQRKSKVTDESSQRYCHHVWISDESPPAILSNKTPSVDESQR